MDVSPVNHLSAESFARIRDLDSRLSCIDPDLREIFDENFAEGSIPTPLLAMAEFAFWATRNRSERPEVVQVLLADLEESYATGPKDIADCISVMFLENLVGEPEMIQLLGPKLRQEMKTLTRI